jgi:hypothetical protein
VLIEIFMPENIPNVHAPYTLYKMDVSYFSGKIEAYLKYKSIPHVAVETGIKAMEDICKHTGTKKCPPLKLKMINGYLIARLSCSGSRHSIPHPPYYLMIQP